MSKATRIRQQNARERIAAQRASARKAEIRNRFLITGGSILLVIVVVVAFIVFKAAKDSGTTASPGSPTGTALPASVVKDITKVPAATLDAVGAGTAYAKSVTSISGPALKSGGKPEMLYIGAEYCPYCATERWAMGVALSRFGTFSGLHGIHSSSTDTDPSTPTLTFYKSTYTSKYLIFTPVETTTENENTPLQTPTKAQQALLTKYDYPPYVAASEQGAIPFIDFANKFLVHGAQYNPQVLQGKTWSEVAAALQDKSSAIGSGADGAANMITATICKITNEQPASVCGSSMIKKMQAS
jgi:thiol-disulfide isomerase/thioredoxin